MTAVTGFTSGDRSTTTDALQTRDTLFGGRVSIEQPARGAGYRVNVDALLLAAFACGMPGRAAAHVAFDLGAGVGGVALALLHLKGAERVVLVEVDAETAEMARRNLHENGHKSRSEVLLGDVRDVARAHRGEAQLIVCNPPYVTPGRGRVAKNPARARARSGELTAFVDAARELAGRRARVCFVYPAHELATLSATFRAVGLEPKRMRAVHATKRSAARVVLVEAQAAKSGGLTVLAPLIERDGDHESEEMALLLARSG